MSKEAIKRITNTNVNIESTFGTLLKQDRVVINAVRGVKPSADGNEIPLNMSIDITHVPVKNIMDWITADRVIRVQDMVRSDFKHGKYNDKTESIELNVDAVKTWIEKAKITTEKQKAMLQKTMDNMSIDELEEMLKKAKQKKKSA